MHLASHFTSFYWQLSTYAQKLEIDQHLEAISDPIRTKEGRYIQEVSVAATDCGLVFQQSAAAHVGFASYFHHTSLDNMKLYIPAVGILLGAERSIALAFRPRKFNPSSHTLWYRSGSHAVDSKSVLSADEDKETLKNNILSKDAIFFGSPQEKKPSAAFSVVGSLRPRL